MKLRMARHLRTPEYNELFAGDPMWITEAIGGMGEDGRTLVTKSSFRVLNTLYLSLIHICIRPLAKFHPSPRTTPIRSTVRWVTLPAYATGIWWFRPRARPRRNSGNAR